MPSYNFMPAFEGQVRSGRKRQTIRAKRRNRPRVGQIAHCFVHLRTKRCRKIGQWPIREVHDVRIFADSVLVDGTKTIDLIDLNAFARADGFGHWDQMQEFFFRRRRRPFHGDLVMWDYKRNAER